MSGSVTIEGQQFGLSAFKKSPGDGKKDYLSLSVGDKDGIHYYGKLFRSEQGRSANSTAYAGFITVLPCDGQNSYSDEEWETAPRLQVCGWCERKADATARIALQVASRTVAEEELSF